MMMVGSGRGAFGSHTALGRRSRGGDHRVAAALLSEIHPGGESAARALLALIDLKDTAHYGLIHITRRQLAVANRRASTLVSFADDVLRR